jgi:hypothetical protein
VLRSVWRRSPTLQGRVASLALLLVIAGGVAVYWNHFRATVPCSDGVPRHTGTSFSDRVGPYDSIHSAIEHSDVIAVGRHVAIVEYELPPNISGDLSYTDFEFEVDEYLIGSGRDRAMIRHRGGLDSREAPGPALDLPMLVYLRQSGALTAGSPFNRMCEYRGSIYYAWGGDGAPREVPYFAGMTLDEAADEVRRVAAEMGR